MVESGFRSSFMREAAARGFIFQCTDAQALDALMERESISAYIGFDPTADSLHVGGLIQIMMLRLLQKHGHRPIALVGGGTARIGDPSFREEARRLMTDDIIKTNLAGIEGCLRQFLTFGTEASDALLVNNADWLDKLAYIDLLRDVGVHFSINRMLSFDSVKNRLEREQGLTFLEFNYSILQSYDFRELSRKYGLVLQLGGSDQWGNIVSGVELVRRTDQKTVMGLTTPLLTTASGAKMGKTASGAVWLSEKRLPVFDYWQFWRNTEDADVGRFLRLFTDLPLEECARLESLQGAEINEAKKVLATEATALCHGRKAALAAAEAARQTFEEGRVTAADLPVHEVAQPALAEGIPVFRLLVEAGLAKTNGEARRLVRGGGARLNNAVIQDENRLIVEQDSVDGAIRLSAGKKHHVLVKVAS
ncbi:tyrosine--tRNA ligase [Acetobacter ghanensis]|uniref:Tyrosine--tRNA ligase n=1 Tax=Acetobacter ghanensis TaxID=431306 RepID=A0A0U5BFQ0_9PROT|nr:tyrosine--tRNA ligase [Acetobacter ghanensis]NHO39896.1 tyrosine--tRNA ligase [Acetobacter ghanensis]CEF53749.1 tyrosyl-tRNA synthetase [Acetobacter ghanensis]